MNSQYLFYIVMILLMTTSTVALGFVKKKIKEMDGKINEDIDRVSVQKEDDISGHLARRDQTLIWDRDDWINCHKLLYLALAVEIAITFIGITKNLNLG